MDPIDKAILLVLRGVVCVLFLVCVLVVAVLLGVVE
jgi:hypothetical protein